MSLGLWTVVFFLLTAALLSLPFYPVWQEWRHPVDALALNLKGKNRQAMMPVSAQVRLDERAATPPWVNASVRILATSGSRFQKLTAPTILLGTSSQAQKNTAAAPRLTALWDLSYAQTWGAHGWRVTGDCHIPDAYRVPGSLVVMGALTLGADCVVDGDIKAHGAVQVGPRTQLNGALFSEQAITLQPDVKVHGPVVSDVHVEMGPGVVIGGLEHPSTLSAPVLVASPGAVVHGIAWATQSGCVA